MATTLEAPSNTLADRIPLGRRIEELKKEKGARYSTAAMSVRIGLSEQTFRDMLKSRRVIYTFELDVIAKDLKMPVARILQTDSHQEVERLTQLVKALKNPVEALELALRLEKQANGISERCHALHRLGIAYIMSFKFHDACQVLTEARRLAGQLHKTYGETDVLFGVVNQLMVVYTAKQEFESAARLLDEIDPCFLAIPSRQSAISYHKAKVEESRGNLIFAKRYAIDSLRYARESENPVQVARACLNLSHYHYLLREYEESEELLYKAIEGLEQDTRTRLIARKELIKTLLKLRATDEAKKQIDIALSEASNSETVDLNGKLVILLTAVTGDPSHAKSVLDDEGSSVKIRYVACRCLQDHYKALNDSHNYLFYTTLAERICVGAANFLDWGEL
ncbi:hypothetical protein [Tumebacillus flagellatus]|uniref:HTH cro/C1-type domain-containing protein n=1 Tax=Tumebacillus flagellatus TaxID=1157490 RepID=A0A074MEP3_9BACL|nr:hypothetical protein [Tumebacillus flagellatus]KEO84262.1 hypothetical protein EL26_05715 [Tumebacillus flagellatus]